MDRIEVFQILGIGETKDEKAIKNAYREKLTVTNPEDDPEGFKRLRGAYDAACRYARETEGAGEEQERDTSVSGLWVERAAQIYGNLETRRDVSCWEELFAQDCFISLEEEENCRLKLLRFLMEHFRLPTDVWKLLDRKLSLTGKEAGLREQFPADFVRYIENKCERGEDVEFGQFEGAPDAPYDLFLQYYDRCWQAIQEGNLEQAAQNIKDADALGIRHPIMEICRADLAVKQGQIQEGLALLLSLRERYPKDAMICYNTAENLWRQGEGNGDLRKKAAGIFKELKAENDSHYMANVRLTEWYYENQQFQEAKKCAEKVLSAGGDETFMELLGKVNREIEKELETEYADSHSWKPALELCWCYLQDGKVSKGIRLALSLEKELPPEKEAEYNGLLSKLYVEEAEYETSVTMADIWQESLERKLFRGESEAEEKDKDRIRQAYLIRMQCYHNLGFADKEYFARAAKEGEGLLSGTPKDIGVLLELAQVYIEMEEYERSLEISRTLVEDYQIYAAHAASLEAYRRQLNAGGVIRSGTQCIQYFPGYIRAYEYMAKVYLDLEYSEDLENLLADAEKNGVKSVILDAYKFQFHRFQMKKKLMDINTLNNKLKNFRTEFRARVEKGDLVFYQNGLPVLTEYLYHYPDSYMLVERGIFHRAAHHYEEAREDFEKALVLNPSNAYALNGLSFVYKYMGEYEKALVCIKKAILYMDQDMSPVIYTDMGELYSLLGNYEMALAACRQYQELVKEPAVWFLEEMAECHVSLLDAQEACRLYARCAGEDRTSTYEKQVDACIRCGLKEETAHYLAAWKEALDNKAGRGLKRLLSWKQYRNLANAYCLYHSQAGWMELVMGSGKAALEQFRASMKYYSQAVGREGKIADAIFACILCGDTRRGAKYAKQLQAWLRQETFSPENKYFNREKGHLQMEFLAAYFEADETTLQGILDREVSCGICHFCTHAICREMEGVRILFLLRQGKRAEARQRLDRNLEIQPADEYMLAIRHIAFG